MDDDDDMANTLADFQECRATLRSKGIDIPFDASRLIANNPLVYDLGYGWGNGDDFGRYARIKSGTNTDLLSGDIKNAPDDIGLIVAQANQRVVAFCENTESYLGWIGPDDYEILDVYFPGLQAWMH